MRQPEAAAARRAAASQAARALPALEYPIAIHVRAGDAAATAGELARNSASWITRETAGRMVS